MTAASGVTGRGTAPLETSADERYFMASQWQLMARKFRKHKLAMVSFVLLGLMYFLATTCEFWAPYNQSTQNKNFLHAPPTRIHLFDSNGKFRGPFVYELSGEIDFETFTRVYTENTSEIYPIRLFQRGDTYKFWGIFRTNLHFFGVGDGVLFVFGADGLGRDLFSRVLYGARVSLSIGLLGVFASFILGCVLGGISGYFGGIVDTVIQRIIEFLMSVPKTPLWMALSAAVPAYWAPIKVYFSITLILSIIGWTGLARVVRGKLLELREYDFVMAAKIAGASDLRIIFAHLLPGFMSYLIIRLTMGIPGMILGETSLSFLGLGIRAPAVSWGTLMQDAQNVRSIVVHPWMLIPGFFVIVAVLLYNWVGDGLRDAADPYR